MERRDAIRAIGTAAAIALVPADARAVWLRVLAGQRAAAGLTVAQLALVTALGDTIIPRTDSPSASDVGVPAWIDLMVDDYYTSDERAQLIAGIAAIDERAMREGGATFAVLAPDARERVMQALDRPADRQAPDARAYSRLKGLVIHGYFTSERVQRDVLRVEIMPGRFEGAAPMPAPRRGS